MRITAFALLIASYFAVPALAQEVPVYTETGRIEIIFGDQHITHYTTQNTVPNDPDRQVHTASWLIMKPQLMGGINIAPDDIFVLITSHEKQEQKTGKSSLQVKFSLNPETFELKAKPATAIRFYPTDDGSFYAMTEGVFKIDHVTRLDANNLAIIASAEGIVTKQNSETIAHNPKDLVKFSARFNLQKIANRGSIQLP